MDKQRLDKWLWCARLYKTRAQAAAAIKGGKIRVNGTRAKPATAVGPGDEITINRPPYQYVVGVVTAAARRGPPAEAAALYRETAQSRTDREALATRLAAEPRPLPQRRGKLSKRERREFERVRRTLRG